MDDLAGNFLECIAPSTPAEKSKTIRTYFLGHYYQQERSPEIHSRWPTTAYHAYSIVYLSQQPSTATADQVKVDDLIVSIKYNEKSFNIQIDERRPVKRSTTGNRLAHKSIRIRTRTSTRAMHQLPDILPGAPQVALSRIS